MATNDIATLVERLRVSTLGGEIEWSQIDSAVADALGQPPAFRARVNGVGVEVRVTPFNAVLRITDEQSGIVALSTNAFVGSPGFRIIDELYQAIAQTFLANNVTIRRLMEGLKGADPKP